MASIIILIMIIIIMIIVIIIIIIINVRKYVYLYEYEKALVFMMKAVFVRNYNKLHQTLFFTRKKVYHDRKNNIYNLGLVCPDYIVLFFCTVNWQKYTGASFFLSYLRLGRTLTYSQKTVPGIKRHLTWVWCALISWSETIVP